MTLVYYGVCASGLSARKSTFLASRSSSLQFCFMEKNFIGVLTRVKIRSVSWIFNYYGWFPSKLTILYFAISVF